jgi:hypothetical protein
VYDVKELGEQLVKNLVFISRVMIRLAGQEIEVPKNAVGAASDAADSAADSAAEESEDEEDADRSCCTIATKATRSSIGSKGSSRLGHGSGSGGTSMSNSQGSPSSHHISIYLAEQSFDISSLLEAVNRQIKKELALNEDLTARRMWSFKLMAAITVELSGHKERLKPLLKLLLTPLVREVTDKKNLADEKKESLVLLAQQALDLIKSCIGEDDFGIAYASTQLALKAKRTEQRRTKALELVQNPEKGVKLRQKKHEKKKVSLKRKFASQKGLRFVKKARHATDLPGHGPVG